MSNAYKTPDSSLLADSNKPSGPNIMWRVLFWLYAPLLSISIIALVFIDQTNSFDYIDMLVSSIIAIGLFGYSYSKKIGSRTIWKTLFFILPLWFVFYEIIVPFILEIPRYGEPTQVDYFLLFNILYIFVLIFIYQYAFKSDHLWDNKPTI
jgi:hypothetical protein